MLSIHPLIQSLGILCVLYAWFLGLSRFRMQHLGHRTRFNWKRHVRAGTAGTVILLLGVFGGLYMVRTTWYSFLVTGLHGKVGLVLLPLLLFALGSGLLMHRRKKRRRVLPLVHGLLNSLLLLLALSQVYTGIKVYTRFVLGY